MRFVTNNASKHRSAYVDKLRKHGIDASLEEVYSSASSAAKVVKHTLRRSHAFVLGMEGVVRELEDVGVKVSGGHEYKPPATMEGLDLPSKPTDWPKELGQALRAARVPCAFVAPNPKRARGNTSNSVLDYDQYMTATTVDEFFSRKGNWGHLKYDVQSVAAFPIIRHRRDPSNTRRVASTASSVPHTGGATARSTRRN